MLIRKNIFPFLLLTPLLFTPFIYSGELYNGIISAKQIWFYAAMALLLAGTGFQVLFQKRSSQISLNRLDIALLLFYGYLIIRAVTTQFMPMLHNARFVNYSLCMVLYFILKICNLNAKSQGCLDEIYLSMGTQRNEEKNENLSGLVSLRSILYWVIAFLIFTGLAQAIWGLLQLYGFQPSFNRNFKITGTFYNPAPYALYLAAIFPMALGSYLFSTVTDCEVIKLGATLCQTLRNHVLKLLRRGTQSKLGVSERGLIFDVFLKVLSLLTIIAILLVLPATMIRAAWLGALAGSVFVLQYKYRFAQTIKQFLNTRTKRIIALILTLTMVTLLFSSLYFLKKNSANGKLFIWEVTLGQLTEKPLFGYGVGRFEAEYNNWQAVFFHQHPEEMEGPKAWVAGNTKYAFNDFLELTSETGVVGLVLFLILIATVFPIRNRIRNTVYGRWLNHKSKNDNTVNGIWSNSRLVNGQSILVLSSFIALIIPMFISLPLFSLPTFILFFVLLGLSSALITTLKSGNWHLVISFWPQKLLALAIFTLAFFLTTFTKNQYTAYYYWDEADKLYKMEAYPEACLSFEKVSNLLHYNGSFLQYQGKATYMNKLYTQADTLLTQAQIYTSDEILYTNLGDNYKALKQNEKAEQAYQTAAIMAPGKLYPLYLLTKLYDETGQCEKTVATAKLIMNKNVKVYSTAIEEIKAEMEKIIERQDNTENSLTLARGKRAGSTTTKLQ